MTTLTAMFDNRSEAEAARQQLNSASISLRDVQIHDQSSNTTGSGGSSSSDGGFFSGLKEAFFPDEDRYTYEEGIRRGGTLLTAEVDDDDADEAIRILDSANCVDVEERASQWRSSGWEAPTSTGATAAPQTTTARTAGNEEHIPIVEEELRVGKREVNRGGVRVRSYTVETPVHEQVSLRDEHVSVERRPVDQPISATGDAFQERTIEMTETAEEAVVAKEARVREELVVRKDVNERVEDVEDTVRRTEVEVDGDRANRGTPERR